jgi:hypothetical protein
MVIVRLGGHARIKKIPTTVYELLPIEMFVVDRYEKLS